MPTGIYVTHKRGPYTSICINGHRISVVGRDSSGSCNACKKNWYLQHYEHTIRVAKQFCKRGHDTFICGKGKNNSCLDCNKQWRKENRDKLTVYDLIKREKRYKRIPKFGQDGIKDFYNNMPGGMNVDHIVPLCGRKVSGLHVIWNLQYMTPKENNRKLNKANLVELSKWYGKLLKDFRVK